MNQNGELLHVPVMEKEVVEMMQPTQHGIVFVDCTLGYGGHSRAISRMFTAEDVLIGIDRDKDALAYCERLFAEEEFAVILLHGGFEELETMLKSESDGTADYFLFDCGFSSVQVDDAERGFSFSKSGPLDMRMDQDQPLNAYDVVHVWSEDELTQIFKLYGEERFSRKIAGAIVRRREVDAIETTQELADIVIQAIPAKYRSQEGIHPATRVFQAIRITVNNELDALRKGLNSALKGLRPGGRIGVLTYHSLEHRIVKELFREYCGRWEQPLGPMMYAEQTPSKGHMLTRKPIRPCAAEIEKNPRSRSAQLRVLERDVAD